MTERGGRGRGKESEWNGEGKRDRRRDRERRKGERNREGGGLGRGRGRGRGKGAKRAEEQGEKAPLEVKDLNCKETCPRSFPFTPSHSVDVHLPANVASHNHSSSFSLMMKSSGLYAREVMNMLI